MVDVFVRCEKGSDKIQAKNNFKVLCDLPQVVRNFRLVFKAKSNEKQVEKNAWKNQKLSEPG
jgi:hypothetical protein